MRACLIFFNALLVCFLIGCSEPQSETYSPSIASLKSNEILIMNVLQCHRGCTTFTVKFENDEATLIPYELKLTDKETLDLEHNFAKKINFNNHEIIPGRKVKLRPKEISDLDRYFLREYSYCSNVIKMSFKHKRGQKVLKSKNLQPYPCGASHDELIVSKLIHYLTDERHVVPYWRLSEEELIQVIKNF